MTNIHLNKWLSAERQWSAAIQWMHQQGRRISLSTLRRALALPAPKTERQRLAVELAHQYHSHKTGQANYATMSADVIPGARTLTPV